MVSLLIRLLLKDYKNTSSSSVQKSYAKLSSCVGTGLNILLFAVKSFAGVLSGSLAIVADGFNNLADAVTSAASFFGFCLAGRGAGEKHLFGHGRYEWVMGELSALAVLLMGTSLAKKSFTAISFPQSITFNALILLLLLASILVKLYMFFYNKRIAAIINSSALRATAADCISDMAATAAIVISLTVQHFTGWKIDGWCGLLVSAVIMFSGLKSLLEIVGRLLGQSADKTMIERITALVRQFPFVTGSNSLLIHDYGLGQYVISLHIEGYEEDSAGLHDSASEIAYRLYEQLDCETTIQIDFVNNDATLHDLVLKEAAKKLQSLTPDACVKNVRIVNSSSHATVLVSITGSGRLQKLQRLIREEMKMTILSINSNFQVITRIGIVSVHSKKQN